MFRTAHDPTSRRTPVPDAFAVWRDWNRSSYSVIVANLVPLLGVVLLHWDAFYVVFFYWVENVVIGFYNALRMATARGAGPFADAKKLFLVPSFCVHYGASCLVHLVFIFVLLGRGILDAGGPGFDPFGLFDAIDNTIRTLGLALPVGLLALMVHHGRSYVVDFIQSGERERVGPKQLMGRPYKRIAVLHIALVLGGIGAMSLGSPLWLLVILIVIKTAVDLGFVRVSAGGGAVGEGVGIGE